MPLELTERQQKALDLQTDDPPRLVDPRTNATYVLLSIDKYEDLRDILEDERRREAIHSIALRNAVGRMNEDQ